MSHTGHMGKTWWSAHTGHTPVTWVKHGGVSVSDVCTFHPNRVVLVLIK